MSHNRSRGRRDDDLGDDEDEFHETGRGGSAYGAVDVTGPFVDEDEEDIDILDRHNQHFHSRRRSLGTTRDGTMGSGESPQAKMPPVKFISRSGSGRSYDSRRDLL